MVARLIAFAAEFGLYEAWALWCGLDFWRDPVWVIVLVGELTSTVGVLLQSEFIMNVEDTIWTTHALYMLFHSGRILQFVVFGGFSAYMVFMHLPMRYARASTKIDLNWYFTAVKKGVKPEFAEKLWVVPMLLGQPLICTMCYLDL